MTQPSVTAGVGARGLRPRLRLVDASVREWRRPNSPAVPVAQAPLPAAPLPPKPKLLDQVRDAIRTRHYS